MFSIATAAWCPAISYKYKRWPTGTHTAMGSLAAFQCRQSLFPEHFSAYNLMRRLPLVHITPCKSRAASRARQVAFCEVLEDATFEAFHQCTFAAFGVTVEWRCALLTEDVDAGSR